VTLFRPDPRGRGQTANPSNWWEAFQRQPAGPSSAAVTNDQALRLSAVYACVDKITSITSAFPVDTYRPTETGRIATPLPPVIASPSSQVDALDWRASVIAAWLLRGNAYGLVVDVQGGVPTHVELIDDSRVKAERARPSAPVTWKVDGVEKKRWPAGDLWHAPGRIWDASSPLGVSVLEYARLTAGLGLATQRFGSDFFDAGGHPTSLVIGDGEVNEDMAKRVKSRFRAAAAGREPVVMGGGWKYEQVQIAPNESQFLDTIKANATDVARFFGVPATIIDAPSGSGMTYNNATQKADDLLKFTINGWVIRLERALTKLLVAPEFVKCNVDALLRADTSGRYMAYDRGLRDGFLSVNDVRRLEDMPPIPDGDQYLWPPYRAFPLDSDQE
jgi:HK97 family phage portal protein